MAQVNLGRGRVDALLKVLDVEGAVARSGTRWSLVPGSDWHYDAERYARVTALRRHEQEAMAAFGADGRCLMRALQEELDDPDAEDCGRCAVCAGARYDGAARPGAGARGGAAAALAPDRARDQEDGAGRERRDAQDPRGRARRGGPRAGAARRRRLGPARAGRAGGRAGSTTSWSPPRPRSCARGAPGGVGGGGAVAPLGRAGAGLRARGSPPRSGLPFADAVERAGDAPPQREMANAAQQVANVRGAVRRARAVPPGACLLVDDIRFSGWTLAMVGGQLRRRGAAAVYPLALSSAF